MKSLGQNNSVDEITCRMRHRSGRLFSKREGGVGAILNVTNYKFVPLLQRVNKYNSLIFKFVTSEADA